MKTHEKYNLKLPTTGVVTSGFGFRFLNGQKQFHNGIDVANKQGTPVVSPAFGTVIKSGFDNLNGTSTLHNDIPANTKKTLLNVFKPILIYL